MGDRTHVQLSMQAHDLEAFQECEGDSTPEVAWTIGDIIFFEYPEVDEGDLTRGDPDFFKRLIARGIAYDSDWGSGNDYGPGGRSGRFTKTGLLIEKVIYDEQVNIDPYELEQTLDNEAMSSSAQLQELNKQIREHIDNIYVMPWTDQKANGLIYRTKQLIGARS